MKYSELISFNPIEDVIQLITADDADKAREYVKTYVMSDAMADSLQAPVIDQLQMDEVVDNKGVLVVGNYGTGKSHLMSVISAIAKDADNLQYLQNKKFAKNMEPIAGKFEVLRIEIGGVTMSLREILFGFIQEDFDARGIDYDVPDFDTVKDNKKLIKDMMMAFNDKYPDKGYLIVVDEFLSYLTSRDERPSHILCKPPRWCIIEAPQWRFYYGKKETHTGRKCPQGKDQRAVADGEHRQHGRHPEPVQRDDCRVHGKRP